MTNAGTQGVQQSKTSFCLLLVAKCPLGSWNMPTILNWNQKFYKAFETSAIMLSLFLVLANRERTNYMLWINKMKPSLSQSRFTQGCLIINLLVLISSNIIAHIARTDATVARTVAWIFWLSIYITKNVFFVPTSWGHFYFGLYISILPLLVFKPINTCYFSHFHQTTNGNSWRDWQHIKIIIKKSILTLKNATSASKLILI